MAEREFRLTFLGDSRKAQAAISDLDQKMGGLGSRISGVTGLAVGPQGLAVAFGGALVGGVLAATKATASYADEVEEMSQRTGLGTGFIQELGHAAKLTGGSLDGLETSVRKMQRTIVDAQDGNKAAIENLAKLNLEVEDLISLRPEEQFEKIAGAIAEVEDPTLKAALAVEFFGRNGTDLLPMLEQGADGLAKMREEAHKLGVVMSEEDVAAAAELQDNLDRLDQKVGALKRGLGNELIPVLIDVTDFFLQLGSAIGRASEFSQGLLDKLGRIPGAKAAAEKLDLGNAISEGSKQFVPGLSALASIADTLEGNEVFLGPSGGRSIAGQFDSGGVIPGPRGAPMLVMAHAGETILPTHKQGFERVVNINIYGSPITTMAELKRMVLEGLNQESQRGTLGFA